MVGVELPAVAVASAQGAPAGGAVDPTLPPDQADRGLVHAGLTRGAPDGPCAGLFQLEGPGEASCTHGPDAAPAGVDVSNPRSVEDIALTTRAEATTAGTTSATVPCYGDGTSGNRVQAVYARASDKPDRYSNLASLFPQWAANADAIFDNSAAKTGGSRHIRWVTDASCNLSVVRATLTPTGDDSLSNTRYELQMLGMDSSDRKYMVWVDANVYCGIADIRSDDQPGAENLNNWGRSWARVDSGCWGYADSPESHEIMHMMGGVQYTAPHGTYAWHCTDESDRMCYPDGTGGPMTYPCPSSGEMLFDCGNDDYFHTAPSPTSYLGTHWNSAMNVFLETSDPVGGTTTTTTTPPTTTPPGTTTSSWSGSFKGNTLSRTYSLSSGSGTMVASSTFTGGSWATLTVKTAAGAVVAQQTGSSGFSMSVPVSAGTYTVTISGTKNMSYTLVDTRPTP